MGCVEFLQLTLEARVAAVIRTTEGVGAMVRAKVRNLLHCVRSSPPIVQAAIPPSWYFATNVALAVTAEPSPYQASR